MSKPTLLYEFVYIRPKIHLNGDDAVGRHSDAKMKLGDLVNDVYYLVQPFEDPYFGENDRFFYVVKEGQFHKDFGKNFFLTYSNDADFQALLEFLLVLGRALKAQMHLYRNVFKAPERDAIRVRFELYNSMVMNGWTKGSQHSLFESTYTKGGNETEWKDPFRVNDLPHGVSGNTFETISTSVGFSPPGRVRSYKLRFGKCLYVCGFPLYLNGSGLKDGSFVQSYVKSLSMQDYIDTLAALCNLPDSSKFPWAEKSPRFHLQIRDVDSLLEYDLMSIGAHYLVRPKNVKMNNTQAVISKPMSKLEFDCNEKGGVAYVAKTEELNGGILKVTFYDPKEFQKARADLNYIDHNRPDYILYPLNWNVADEINDSFYFSRNIDISSRAIISFTLLPDENRVGNPKSIILDRFRFYAHPLSGNEYQTWSDGRDDRRSWVVSKLRWGYNFYYSHHGKIKVYIVMLDETHDITSFRELRRGLFMSLISSVRSDFTPILVPLPDDIVGHYKLKNETVPFARCGLTDDRSYSLTGRNGEDRGKFSLDELTQDPRKFFECIEKEQGRGYVLKIEDLLTREKRT